MGTKGVKYMIMIWNQKEVYCGYSLHQFNKVMDVLDLNKIKYKYKIVNNFKPGGGTFGQSMKYAQMYYVYVHQKDYDEACFALKDVKYEP